MNHSAGTVDSATAGPNPMHSHLIATPRIDVRLALTKQQRGDFRKAFDIFDTSGTGTMDAKDLRIVLRALGYDPSAEEVHELIKPYAVESRLDFNTFLATIHDRMCRPDPPETLIKAFKMFDRGGKGFITFEDLKEVASNIDAEHNDEELREMIDKWDRNEDGVVGEEEFISQAKQVHLLYGNCDEARPHTHREYEKPKEDASEEEAETVQ